MPEKRTSIGLRWFFVLLFGEIALLFTIFYLRGGEDQATEARPAFNQVQRLNLQSLINAKGYSCPQPPALHYEQAPSGGVAIIAICRQANGEAQRFVVDFKGHVRKG
jgi:hypothetical protein